MSGKKIIHILLIAGLISILMGCIAPENKINADTKTMVGGVVVGISPRVIYAEKGENVSFNVDLQSTEKADDKIKISVNGSWINRKAEVDLKSGGKASIPVQILIPEDALNMSYMVKVLSSNLNMTSSTTGVIIIINKGDKI